MQSLSFRKIALPSRSMLLLQTILFPLAMLCAAQSAWAQVDKPHFLGRETATEYIFDTPLPADFAAMVTASGSQYRAVQNVPKLSPQTLNGKTYRIITSGVSWDGDKVDRGHLAISQNGRVEANWWFQMDASNPQWPAVAARLKADAVANGNWRHVNLRILVADDANQPSLRLPMPETLQIQKQMDGFDTQTRPGQFYSSVQIPADLDRLRAQMLAYGNVARRNPDFRKEQGAKTATNLSGNTVQTLGGTEKVFKQNTTPPWFTDAALDDKLNQAAQFQAEYNASIDVMSHNGPSAYTDPKTGKTVNMRDLGARAQFFGVQSVVEAAGMGKARDYPHNWMASDTHFRPWFSVDGVYPKLGYGAARSAKGNWHFVAVPVRHPDGVIPGGSENKPAPVPSAPQTAPAPTSNVPAHTLSLVRGQKYYSPSRSHYFVFQNDGNLVVYAQNDRFVWGLNTVIPNAYSRIGQILLQTDGNLVAYTSSGEYLWSALHAVQAGGTTLNLSDSGELMLVAPNGAKVWSSQ